ncbi:TerD family protein [Chitinimonas arctica]|uniref:TerD family protein n=1 Tax=Chitinimonas arctica TaxID=2594795 RepID=A0A516SLI2_9NEIS|nr:TerD family protein [Chitinimonas arctica]QDQ29020.1 TerD family protein [Chitinimonas arctica]
MSINLTKKQTINLTKENKSALTAVTMGLGWDTKGGLLSVFSGDIDLDASCLMFDDRQQCEAIWFRRLNTVDGSIRHSGDNRTGAGGGDDETIQVQFDKLSPSVQHLVFTVNSFTGQKFDRIKNAYCRVVNDRGVEVARYALGDDASGSHTGLILMKVSRGADGDWHCTAVGQPANGRTWQDMRGDIEKLF